MQSTRGAPGPRVGRNKGRNRGTGGQSGIGSERGQAHNRQDHRDRSRSPYRSNRDRSRSPVRSSRTRDRSRSPYRPNRSEQRGRSPPRGPRASNRQEPKPIAEPVKPPALDENMDPDEYMKRVMGFSNFKSTKNTKVAGNDFNYGVRIDKETRYRQYMNRSKGFNRPLSPVRQRRKGDQT